MSRLNILLLTAVLVSAVIVVTVRHKNRLEFIALQNQEQRHHELEAEWGRLMLEKATWTSQHNVADDAKKRLAMSAPSSDKIITLDLNAQKTDSR